MDISPRFRFFTTIASQQPFADSHSQWLESYTEIFKILFTKNFSRLAYIDPKSYRSKLRCRL